MLVAESSNVVLWIVENSLTDTAAALAVTPSDGIIVVDSSLAGARSIRTSFCVKVRIKPNVNCVNSYDQVVAVFQASVW